MVKPRLYRAFLKNDFSLTKIYRRLPIYGTRFAYGLKHDDYTCFCVKRVRARVGTLALFFAPNEGAREQNKACHSHGAAYGAAHPFREKISQYRAQQPL